MTMNSALYEENPGIKRTESLFQEHKISYLEKRQNEFCCNIIQMLNEL